MRTVKLSSAMAAADLSVLNAVEVVNKPQPDHSGLITIELADDTQVHALEQDIVLGENTDGLASVMVREDILRAGGPRPVLMEFLRLSPLTPADVQAWEANPSETKREKEDQAVLEAINSVELVTEEPDRPTRKIVVHLPSNTPHEQSTVARSVSEHLKNTGIEGCEVHSVFVRDVWEDDSVQFPRLLAEIAATQDKLDIPALAQAMDLSTEEVGELFDRAQDEWERVKIRVSD